jgi:cytochrome c553
LLRHVRRTLAGVLLASAAFAQDGSAVCASCHGADGSSQTPGVPSIAGQPKLFIENQLILFREGLRVAREKQPIVRELSDREIVRLAQHFAALPARPAVAEQPDPAQAQRAIALARNLHCGTCHLPDFRGREQMPRLAGQREEYLAESMLAYRDNRRAGGDTIMAAALYGVSDADIRALAHYLARLR